MALIDHRKIVNGDVRLRRARGRAKFLQPMLRRWLRSTRQMLNLFPPTDGSRQG